MNCVNIQRTKIYQWNRTFKEINIIDGWIMKLGLLQPILILFKENPNQLKTENYEKWQINTKLHNKLKDPKIASKRVNISRDPMDY